MSGRSPRGMPPTPSSNGGGANSSFLAKSPTRRQERQTNFKVVIRVRPPLPRELSGDVPFQNVVAVDEREQLITVSENLEAVLDENGNVIANPGQYNTHCFTFDHVYDENASQKRVYETTARSVVDSALLGYNATIFAYGQTGTGKTFTMEGFNREGNVEARGIIPRAIEQIFGHIQRYASPRMRFLVRASYLQIYNEAISDLLKPERSNLTIREDKKRGVYVEGLSEWVVRSPAEIYGLMERGGTVRATGETKMNEASSRSHAVFIIIAEQSETVYVDDHGAEMTPEEFQKFMHGRGVRREQEMSRLEDHVRQSFKVGKLNLVDLAGSERVRISGASGQRLEESKQINRSLSALGNVISALTDTKARQHIPYRDSKLTRMLEDSLGGNCRTTMMAMISPALEAMLETISTLKFANRAKNIRNEARVNEDLDQKSLLRKYERELKKLRAELEERSKNVVDKRRLLELDEQRRRAEADKMAAIKALEARSLEFMHEKEEKKRLEQRIAMLMGQMIRGERSMAAAGDEISTYAGSEFPVPEIQVMMKEQQEKLRQEYEGKLADLERERESIEEEKAQVDRYKQLLLKQRDIMIALTQRLVERDEQIMALQDELDAYDRHHKELEEKLDEKTALLIKFQRISMEVNAVSPHKNEELRRAIESWSIEEQQAAMAAQQGRGGGGQHRGGGGGGSKKRGMMTNQSESQESEEATAVSTGSRVRFDPDTKGPTEVDTEEYDDESTVGSGVQHFSSGSSGKGSRTSVQPYSSPVDKGVLFDIDEGLRLLERSGILGGDTSTARSAKEAVGALVKHVINARMKSSSSSPFGPSPFADINGGSSSMGTAVSLTANAAIEELQRLRRENLTLEQRVRSLESSAAVNGFAAAAGLPPQPPSSALDRSFIEAKCEVLVREREAVQTIMEQKIKVLVHSVAHAVTSVLQTVPQGGGMPGLALSKDVAALQRLVNASIAALRNASSTLGQNPNSLSNPLQSPVKQLRAAPPAGLTQHHPQIQQQPQLQVAASGPGQGGTNAASNQNQRQHGHGHGQH